MGAEDDALRFLLKHFDKGWSDDSIINVTIKEIKEVIKMAVREAKSEKKVKHTLMCSCGKLALKCGEASKGLVLIIAEAKKEVFDEIFKEHDFCLEDGAYLERLEKKHSGGLKANDEKRT